MSPDAFRHVPELLGAVTSPEQSQVRATPQRLAVWDAHARRFGHASDWRLSERELEDSRQAVLCGRDARADLWVFGYGSLMWDPAIHFEEVRRAELPAHRRCFSLRTTLGRGSPEHPGLMLSLDPGAGRCRGLAFRVAAARIDAEMALFWRREMIVGSYRPRLLPVATPQGPIEALVLASNPAHRNYVGEVGLEEAAATIARGAGFLGTNRQYLEQLALKLDLLRIDDERVRRLWARVQQIAPG